MSLLDAKQTRETNTHKDAGFHVVQASLLLTRHLPLKEALVLLTTIPKGIFT